MKQITTFLESKCKKIEANEDINESLFKRNKKPAHKPAFHSDFQQWDNWAAQVISDLVYAFEEYQKKNPEYDPQTDEYPENFDKEVIEYANRDYDFFDTLHCLYRCYYNGDFDHDDIGVGSKVKFSD